MVKYLIALTLFLATLSHRALTQSVKDSNLPVADKIDNYLLSAVDAFKFNGVALVAHKGKVIFHKAYGWKNIDNRTYNDTGTIFPILSITKSITAVVILKLQEQNRLSLKDPLSMYLPDFPNGKNITLEHLVTHTSGVYNFTDDIGEEDSSIVNHPVTHQRIIDLVSSKPPSFEPGKGFGYNNSGYFLAGLVIEKVTGKTYWQNVREIIFDPLGMRNSGFDFNHLEDGIAATGYQFLNDSGQKPYNYMDSTVSFSAGGIYSTTGDLYKWTQAIANHNLLTTKSWKSAFKRKAGDYGIGFRINNFFGKDFVRHSGGYPGFASEFIYYPEEEITIILLRNTGNYGQDMWPLTMGISSIVFGWPYDLWRKRSAIKFTSLQLEPMAGKFSAGKLKIEVLVKEGQLIMLLPDGNEFTLLAEKENVFYLENFNTQLRFEKNDQLLVDKVVIHEHGMDLELKRIGMNN